jgi:hypothetical protein
MKALLKISLILIAGNIIYSCKKKFDLPPDKNIANSGSITIDSIVGRYINHYIINTSASFYRFSGDANLTCTVTADEISGNLYKQVFVEDGTGGLQLKLINGYGLNIGDKIRINLNSVLLDAYGQMVQLDSIDISKRVVKISSGNPVVPVKATFNQLMSLNYGLSKFQSRLVLLDSVEFAAGDKGQFFSDTSAYKYAIERTLLNSAQVPVVVRTSGYANFAKNFTPCGKGSVIAVAGQYNSTIQLTIRQLSDVNINYDNCPLLIKNFNDGSVLSGGWSNYRVSGATDWTFATHNGQLYGQISNYVSGQGNQLCEAWLISPPIDLSSAPNPNLSFQSAYNYSGPALTVCISTNYNSGDPSAAAWTPLNATLSSGSWAWVGSGVISLNSYKSTNTRIAFRYAGTASSGSTWEIDDIVIFSQ